MLDALIDCAWMVAGGAAFLAICEGLNAVLRRVSRRYREYADWLGDPAEPED